MPRKRLNGTTTSSPSQNVANDDPSGIFSSGEEPFKEPKQQKQVESSNVETIEVVSEGDEFFNSPGVLSESADLEEDSSFVDTQFRIGDEEYDDTEDVDNNNDDNNNDEEDCDDHEDVTEQDAQSLGITTPSSDFEEENNDEKNVEPDNKSNERRAKGS